MASHGGKDIGTRLMAPFVVLLGVSLLLIYGAIALISLSADRLSEARELRLVTTAINSRIGSTASHIRDLMILTPLDQVAMNPSMQHERFILLDANGKIVLNRLAPQATPWSDETTARVVEPSVRALNDPTLQRGQAVPVGLKLAWVSGQPLLVLAVHAPAHPGATAVNISDLQDAVSSLAALYNLSDLRLVQASSEPANKRAAGQLQLINIATNKVWFSDFDLAADWTRIAVGQRIVMQILPIILVVTLLVLLGGFWLVHRARTLARNLVASETHAKHLALHDPMTGLANRLLFTDRLDHALEHRRRTGGDVAVVCIDLDRFKKVNDTLGHQAGDTMIKEASRRITGVCRASDTVARLGGDEFALVLAPIDGISGVKILCDRLVEALTSVLNLPEGQATLSASLGVTLINDSHTTGEDAMRQADLALYGAKAEGRGCYALFEPAMDENLRLRRLVETELRDVMDAGGLEVAYQPQYTAKGKMEGVEALVRWTHPVRGPIPPDQFIPIAEEAGLIDQLGDFVMQHALADAARWPDIKMAINVSPIQLRRPAFADRCLALATAAGVDPKRVELEITEGVLVDSDATVQGTLRRLREIGFRLALDDFGTGYSSLSYLNDYAVDKIKIDRSFVNNLSLDGETDKVVSAIIHLGMALGLSVTAEGVETEAQRLKLVAAGCNSLQGYLHGRPTTAAAIDTLLGIGGAGEKVA